MGPCFHHLSVPTRQPAAKGEKCVTTACMMKYLWLTLLVVAGTVVAAASAEEEITDDLQTIQGRRQRADLAALPALLNPAAKPTDPAAIANDIKDAAAAFVANPTEQIMLKIGNVLAAVGDIADKPLDAAALATDPLDAKLGALGALGTALTATLTPLLGAAGATLLGGGLVAFSALKTAFLNVVVKVLETVNFVFAIVALALLVVYLVDSNGDITGLTTGLTARAGYYYDDMQDTYNEYARSARSMFDSPIVQRLTDLVYDAITKYD
ncbi:hypothetical protein Pmani_018490 [Petrolisthes manimaculis]|uniref:Uncharacterized protein n=1 Tax=Petrolisthes manimaculis TaxID=1843537 RepID=A0AAE1PK45_9EUCA|nr:hypothetical protein Pmani_018490 [Petrolisthes manimaculis]